MKKIKRILAAALSVLTLSTCSITVGAGAIDTGEDSIDARCAMLIDPNYPAKISVNDNDVASKFDYKIDKVIFVELADNIEVNNYNLKYDLEKANYIIANYIKYWREFTGNLDNLYTCKCEDLSISELMDYAAQLREMDGVVTVKAAIISYHTTFYLQHCSKEDGLTIYIGDGKSLDELKADKEFSSYVDSIGGTITSNENGQSYITGIADREHFREIITKINSFEVVDNKAFFSWYCPDVLAYSVKLLEDDISKYKGDINNDGKITAADASIAFSAYKKNYTSGGTGLSELELYNADFNGDGKVTAEDASGIFSQYKKTYQS